MLPQSKSTSAAQKSQYQRQKRSGEKLVAAAAQNTTTRHDTPLQQKCPQCGRSAHTKSACPATSKTCNGCKATGHLEKMCPKKSAQLTTRTSKIGQLKL